eukprot:INCI9520.4.p1 GENE.INCI9520.4~~INCI9520.4.p1  ORF type:complete len:193 (+),score=42.91 INCI9520.4:51-629(+)
MANTTRTTTTTTTTTRHSSSSTFQVLLLLSLSLVVLGKTPQKEEADARDERPGRTPREVTDPEVLAAAQFAVLELQGLSDSGIYETLTLGSIHSAATEVGIYHHNTILDLDLKSPYLQNGVETSRHTVIVMSNLADGTRSFAIDEFPNMDEDASEQFWIRKVERHRAMRAIAFAEIEQEFGPASASGGGDEL